MISWLCLMFREIPLSPPQLIVLVYVHVLWLLASKTHNLIWRKVSCYAYLFISNEIAHKIPLSTLHTWLHSHSQSVEGCVTNWKWENVPSVLWLPEEKLWSRARGSLPGVALLFMCSCCHKNWLTYSSGVSHLWPLDPLWWFFLSPLLSQSFVVGNPDSRRWTCGMTPHSGMGTGRQRAEAVAQGKASATARMAAKNPTPWARSHNTGNIRSSAITADQQPPQVGLSGGRK